MKRPKLKIKLKLPAIFRWRYVLPRVAIVAAIVAAVRLGLDPLLKYALVAGGEAALGAKVEVAELSTSVLDGRLVLNGLAAANPQKPMRNLAEAEQVHLAVDFGALLKRRLIVKNGLIRGLQFDSERATSGALETEDSEADADAGPSMLDPAIAAASESALAWFDGLQGRFQDDLEAKLATPRVLRELEDRWKQQYENLKSRADELRAKGKQIERDVREVRKNPLRGMQQLDSLQKQLAAAQAELRTTLAEIEALPAQAKADRQAIDAARKEDEALLRESLQIAKTDGGKLSEYLLGEVAYGYVTKSASWVSYARSWIPQTKMARPERARGVNVLFESRRRPKCLIERVELAGTARLAGQPFEFTGFLTDVASEPEWHDRPTQLHLVGGGAIEGNALVTIDRRNGAAHDTIVVDCPHLALGERTLGKADKLAVNIAPGDASLAAELTLDGEELSGFIRWHQASTISASTGALRDDRIATMLGESLRGVDRLEANIQVAGTLRRPTWRLESNLGPQLAEGFNSAARRYLTERRDRLVAKVQGQVDEQLAKLDARRQEAQQELLALLGENQQLIAQVASLFGGGHSLGGLSIPQMGAALSGDRIQR